MGLSKHRRLRRREEFRTALRRGNRARDGLLSITAVNSNDDATEARYGFAISKRVGNAVVRNRIKRRLKAIVGTSNHPKGWDYVIYAFPPASAADSNQLRESVHRLTRRAMLGRSSCQRGKLKAG